MPLYEFRCLRCRNEFERILHVDEPNPPCPFDAPGLEEDEEAIPCGGETERLISRNTFHLKGGGWAADGYSSSGTK